MRMLDAPAGIRTWNIAHAKWALYHYTVAPHMVFFNAEIKWDSPQKKTMAIPVWIFKYFCELVTFYVPSVTQLLPPPTRKFYEDFKLPTNKTAHI